MEKNLIDLLFMSTKRRDLLLLLEDGNKSIEEILDVLQVKSTGMLPQIKKLKDEHMVLQVNKEYMLTPIAKTIVKRMEPLLDLLEVIEEHEDFWQEHDLNNIPRAFLERLNELKPYTLVKPDIYNIFEPPAILLENINKSKNILLLSSVFHPIFCKFLKKEEIESEMSLIVTERVFSRLKMDFKDELELYLTFKKKKLFVCTDEVKIGLLTKTERFMLAGLLTTKGNFDHESIISFQPTALKWAEDLILYYLKQSRKISRI